MPKEATRVDPAALVTLLLERRGADSTGDRILSVACDMLVSDGLSALEVDEVAVRAGVGRSTIYRRYGDRNGLIVAALATEVEDFFRLLAEAVAPVDDVEEEVVAAFCAGLRVARARGLDRLLRTDPLLLRLLTVDGQGVLSAAARQLAGTARGRAPDLDPIDAERAAELLVRLAISFVLVPETALDVDGDISEDAIRRHVAPLVRLAPP